MKVKIFFAVVFSLLMIFPQISNISSSNTFDPSLIGDFSASLNVDFTIFQGSIDYSLIENHLNFFVSQGSRISGYPGCDAAADYIYNYFQDIGLSDVSYDPFQVTVPVDYGAFLELEDGSSFNLYPMEPNLVCPVVADDLSGSLIYVGRGNLEDLEGKPINGSIVLMDYVSDINWLKAARLGAKAVIFLEPDPQSPYPTVFENRRKSMWIPFNFPRLYMKLVDFVDLLPHLSFNFENPTFASVTSKVVWETRQASNIIGVVEGEEEGVIIYSSYYDSYSPVLSIAPGANSALGVSTLLEVARLFTNPQYKPKYTIMFVAYAGHFQALEGARIFYNRTLSVRTQGTLNPLLQVNLQITTLTDNLVTMNGGQFIWKSGTFRAGVPPYDAQRYGNLDDYVIETIYPTIDSQTSLGSTLESACLKGYEQTELQDMFPLYLRMDDAEVYMMNGGPGYMLQTADFGENEFYPLDNMDFIDFDNLKSNGELAIMLLYGLAQTIGFGELTSNFNQFGYTQHVTGVIAEYDEAEQWYVPIPNAIVVAWYDLWPTRIVTFADDNGVFNLWDARAQAWGADLEIAIYVINETTGNIEYAPTQTGLAWFTGMPAGPEPYAPQWIDIGFYVLFECGTAVLFDTQDPRSLQGSSSISVVSKDTKTSTDNMGENIYGTGSIIDFQLPPEVETSSFSVRLLFIPTEITVLILIPSTTSSQTPYPVGILSNSTNANPKGFGYLLNKGDLLVFHSTPFNTARDMYRVTEVYVDVLEAKSLGSEEFRSSLQKISSLLENATVALENYSYQEFYYLQTKAWSYAKELYDEVRNTYSDIIGVIPYFALLLIPFSFLVERLVFQEENGKKRIILLVTIFSVIYLIFNFSHPSFSLAANPSMVILGFLIFFMVLPAIYTIFNYDSRFLKRLMIKEVGMHIIEVSRGSAASLAFQLGSQNLRKRKLRTILTLLTIILITMGITLFSSIQSITSITVSQYEYETPFLEVYLTHEDVIGNHIGTNIIEFVEGGYGEKAEVMPVTWLFTRGEDDPSFNVYFDLSFEDKEYGIYVLLGMSSAIEHPILTFNLTGRWFIPGETFACILPDVTANVLDVNLGERITLLERELTVVGIASSDILSGITTLTGEEFLPIDYRQEPDPANPLRVEIEDLMIVPLEFTYLYNPRVVSIDIFPVNTGDVIVIGEDLYNALPTFTIIGGTGESVIFFSKTEEVTLFGWQMQVIPIALAAIMILNLLLGGIRERERDIFVFSSVGLSPLHVTFMFLAEASIYAVVGGLLGYVSGMGIYQVMPLVSGSAVQANYSTGFVTMSIGLMMGITLLSSVYPAIKASRLITPSLERSWKIPTKPMGNTWEIPLPVVFQDKKDSVGAYKYMKEYMQSQAGEYGYFSPEGEIKIIKEGETIELNATTRLAPYDQGVIHDFKLRTTLEEGKWMPTMILERKSGQSDAWQRLTRRFATEIRQQLLLWKTLPSETKSKYL